MFKSGMFKSDNPALANDDAFQQFYGDVPGVTPRETATVQGVVNKTAILVGIAVVGGAAGYSLSATFPAIQWISAIAAMMLCFGFFFVLRGNPGRAKFLAPIYALVEGVFLGALSGSLDSILASQGLAVAGGVATQAFIITLSIALAMLGLYKARILKPTKRFAAVVTTMAGGIMLVYLISWPLSLFGIQLPFVSLNSAFSGGTPALIGIGVNVLILGVASLMLILDFGRIEAMVESGAKPDIEWYCGFALLVTLAWIYYEAVKLVFRIAILLGNRE